MTDPSLPESSLGAIIRAQREAGELSMRQFARMVGISNPYLSQIERGLREPSEKVVDAIADSLQVSAEALYARAGRTREDEAEEEEERPVLAAIRADPRLTGRQRQALVEVYEAFISAPRAARRRPPAPRSAPSEPGPATGRSRA